MNCATLPKLGHFQVPFGLRGGRLFEPLDVERGKDCNCTCPGCGAALIAKHAPAGKVSPHFAHASGQGCGTGLESALHLAAKQLIADRKELYLPKLEAHVIRLGVNDHHVERKKLLRPGGLATLKDIRLEESLGAIRPDLIVTTQSSEVLVEIARTSFVTPEKLGKIKMLGVPAIEFDVSSLTNLDFKGLEAILFAPSDFAKWSWHPDEEAAAAELTSLVDAEIAEDRVTRRQAALASERFQQEVSEDFALMGYQQTLAGEKNRYAKPDKVTFVSRFEQRARLQAFRQLSSDEKIQSAVDAMGDAGWRVRELLPLKVSGTNIISASALAWQAPVFALFVHKAMKRSEIIIDADVIRGWLKERFAVADDKAVGVAVWYFLKGLEDCGIVHRKFRQEFTVLAPDLLGALAIARDKKSGEVRPLKWVDAETVWPSREKSNAVASAFGAAFGEARGWERIAGLLPKVCTIEKPEDTVLHYSNAGSQALTTAYVRRFLVATGFVE